MPSPPSPLESLSSTTNFSPESFAVQHKNIEPPLLTISSSVKATSPLEYGGLVASDMAVADTIPTVLSFCCVHLKSVCPLLEILVVSLVAAV